MLNYLSITPSCGGRIKQTFDDFIVEEITQSGLRLKHNTCYQFDDTSGDYLYAIVQKKGWNTSSLVLEFSRRLKIPHKYISFAGSKDRRATTVQLFSFKNVEKERLLSLNIKDVCINGVYYCNHKLTLGNLLGNGFIINVPEVEPDCVHAVWNELKGKFPNYYGPQRFGSTRNNTAKIGELILKEDFESAVLAILCDLGNEESETIEARQNLKETLDFHAALKEFPRFLRIERMLLEKLSKGTTYLEALKTIPRTTLLLYIHAFQSRLFNELISERLPEPELERGEYFCGETFGFPDIKKPSAEGWLCAKVIGYTSPINEREKAILEKYGISKEDFKIPKIPQLASKGTYRPLFSPVKDFSFNEGFFSFILPSGSYATSFLREFLKND